MLAVKMKEAYLKSGFEKQYVGLYWECSAAALSRLMMFGAVDPW